MWVGFGDRTPGTRSSVPVPLPPATPWAPRLRARCVTEATPRPSEPGGLAGGQPRGAHQPRRPGRPRPPGPCQHLLGVGLLHQGAPELVAGAGVAVDELVVDRGQPVIDDHVHPLPKAPEVKVEDARVGTGFLGVPLLLLPVGDDLGGEGDRTATQCGSQLPS